ncbi:hypothetical protein BLNAU_16786 [Blattamonas nauphoetae]|uniref:Uncharacterized protein n=1 Tax=Blattamonas nauphoetae TaxID=2049346 RepID=A0ABQ9XDF7_9EUKA|nr:hypothetical protein BLNAU_16786 [Blattamonas nauphoetae]
MIQKMVTVAGQLGFNYSNNDAQFHSTTSFLCRLMGVESLETRLCVLQAVYRNLDGVRFKNPPLEWPVTETTLFSVNSDGTRKEETLLGKCSILLTESMKAIDTLLADLCDEYLKTLSNHCKLVTSSFSCLALLGVKNDEAKEILKSKGVMQQIGVWTGSLLETPLSPARTEAVLPIVEILVDVQSYSHSDDLISLDLVFPDSSTPLADLLTLIEPLLTINSNTAKTVIARFLRPCSKCCRPDSEDKSLLFAFFNKFVASEDFLRVDFEEFDFHDSILSFLYAHLFQEDSTDLTRIDTPSLHAYLPRILLSHGQTSPNLNGQVSWFVRVVTGLICQSLASLQFWKDVGGVAAIVHVLSLEECAESSHFALKAINENILFPYRSIPTPELRTLILRELEEEGLSDAVELIMNDNQNPHDWNVNWKPILFTYESKNSVFSKFSSNSQYNLRVQPKVQSRDC